MIQITRSSVVFNSDADLNAFHDQFKNHNSILIENFIEKELFIFLAQQIEQEEFQPAQYVDVGSEITLRNSVAGNVLTLLMNDKHLFEAVQSLTDCPDIRSFTGRIYRMFSDQNHTFDWHDDARNNRLIGLSINLSDNDYLGGEFQIRDVKSGRIQSSIKNSGRGDAILFQIQEGLEHRVTPLSGKYPKTSFSGWFMSKPLSQFRLTRI